MAKTQDSPYEPDYAVPPGETLRESLVALGMTQSDLALRTGRPAKTINEIMQGKAAITPETALQFERVLNVPASFWNNLQRNYEADLARLVDRRELESHTEWLRKSFVRETIRRGWVRSHNDRVQQMREILTFLGVAAPGQWNDYLQSMRCSLFRMSSAFRADEEALAFWLRKGELEARSVQCVPFDQSGFRKALQEVRHLTLEPPTVGQSELKARCASAGVAVVLVPELPSTRVSGATRWLTPTKGLIQLSLRYKTDDHLWFSFFHEAGHILLHRKRPVYVDFLEGARSDAGPEEREADKFAADTLVPPSSFEPFVAGRKLFSEADVQAFAKAIGIAPGIVVGRLQHEGLLPHSHLNRLKRALDFAE